MQGLSRTVWGVWLSLVACAIGCSGKTVESASTGVGGSPSGAAGSQTQPPDPAGSGNRPHDSVEPQPGPFTGALSVQSIPGEAFSQVWGTDGELWILGAPWPPPEPDPHAQFEPTVPCAATGFMPSNILRRRTTGTFEVVDHMVSTPVASMRGSSESDLWLVGPGGGVYQFDGQTWHQHDVRSAQDLGVTLQTCGELSLLSVFPRSPEDVWVVGYIYPYTTETGPGLILHYDGQVWKRHPVGAPDGFFGVWAGGADDVWAVGSSGLAYHYDGASWGRVNAATEHYLFSVLGAGSDDVWAVGNTSVATHFDGDSWQLIEPSEGYSTSRVLAGNQTGGFWKLTTKGENQDPSLWRELLMRWDGEVWREMQRNTDKEQALADLYMTPGGQLWGVGRSIVRFR